MTCTNHKPSVTADTIEWSIHIPWVQTANHTCEAELFGCSLSAELKDGGWFAWVGHRIGDQCDECSYPHWGDE